MPIKPFVFFSPVEWLGRLLSRPGAEEEMDQSWTNARESYKQDPHLMRDIFDGEVLRNFMGPDGKHFSLGNGEGRYVFSVSVDFFNPLSNKQAGKKVSVGLITLVCLNLPPHLRYKPENIFLAGVIPGPNEPRGTAINHFLRPLVDHFMKMWQSGIRYTHTARYPHGRLVRCAIVCVVCDLPAARKTTGFVSTAHNHFCAICNCTLKSNGYHDTNYSAWTRRTNMSCRRAAKQYRRAGPSVGETIVAETGVRWSQLLRLPYFDPSRFVVVDLMHNLFLGLLHEHFNKILGLPLPKDGEEAKPVLHLPLSEAWKNLGPNEQKSMRRLIRWLELPMCKALATEDGRQMWQKRLQQQHKAVLGLLCHELQVSSIPTHPAKTGNPTCADYARGLVHWVCINVNRL